MNIESSERLGGRDTIAWLACYRRLNQLRDGTLRNFEADGRVSLHQKERSWPCAPGRSG